MIFVHEKKRHVNPIMRIGSHPMPTEQLAALQRGACFRIRDGPKQRGNVFHKFGSKRSS
jgi:hypothetical protein